LGLAVYDDGYQNGFAYGWWLSTAPNPSSTAEVRIGCSTSLETTFDGGYSGAVFTNNGVSITSYSTFQFSVYGGPGTNGEQIQVDFNTPASPAPADNIKFTIVEGQWTDFTMPLSTWTIDLNGNPMITQVQIQDVGWANPGTVYFDRVGFN
jgi:hypothetical protein